MPFATSSSELIRKLLANSKASGWPILGTGKGTSLPDAILASAAKLIGCQSGKFLLAPCSTALNWVCWTQSA